MGARAEAVIIGGTPTRSRVQRGMRALRSAPPAILVGGAFLAFFVVIAILGPAIAPYNPTQQVGHIYASPSAAHPLGLDDGGNDVLSQLIVGARTSLVVGLVAAVAGMLIGGAIGVVSGYMGGRVDGVLMRITDYFLVIPDIPLMIITAAVFGRNTRNIIVIIALIYWTTTARLIRAQVHSIRERVYVRRAEMLGASRLRVLWTHVIPQVGPLLVANTVLMIANAIFAETYISFLGLGDPSTISWGSMIQNALNDGAIFYHAWWVILPPGIAVTLVVLAATIVGQGIEDALNPRLKVGHLAVRRFRLRPLYGELDRE
jgi:peptide/nickel transport system permease protein